MADKIHQPRNDPQSTSSKTRFRCIGVSFHSAYIPNGFNEVPPNTPSELSSTAPHSKLPTDQFPLSAHTSSFTHASCHFEFHASAFYFRMLCLYRANEDRCVCVFFYNNKTHFLHCCTPPLFLDVILSPPLLFLAPIYSQTASNTEVPRTISPTTALSFIPMPNYDGSCINRHPLYPLSLQLFSTERSGYVTA